jgi:hypothetical protein
VAFLGTQLIIANQSYFAGNPQNQALLDLETGEPGQPVYVPAVAGSTPVASRKPATKKHRRPKHRRRRHGAPKHRAPAFTG